MSEGMREVVVGLDQVQELVLIEIGLDVVSVENTIILQKTVKPQRREGNRKSTTDYNMDKEQTPLKTLLTDTSDSLN